MVPVESSRPPLRIARAGALTAVAVAVAVLSMAIPAWLAPVGVGLVLVTGLAATVAVGGRRRHEPILVEMRLLRPID